MRFVRSVLFVAMAVLLALASTARAQAPVTAADLTRLETSVNHIVLRVNKQYAQACGGAVTQTVAAANAGGQFLVSVPCDANGVPLAAPVAPLSAPENR